MDNFTEMENVISLGSDFMMEAGVIIILWKEKRLPDPIFCLVIRRALFSCGAVGFAATTCGAVFGVDFGDGNSFSFRRCGEFHVGFKYGGFSCFYSCSLGLEWITVFVRCTLDVLLLAAYPIGVAKAPSSV